MPALTKAKLDAAVYAAIAEGIERRTFKRVIGAPESDIAASIQRLRWAGRVKLNRLAINDVAAEAPAIGDVINDAVAVVPATAPLQTPANVPTVTTEALILVDPTGPADALAPGHVRIPILTLSDVAAQARTFTLSPDVVSLTPPAPLADVVKEEALDAGRRRKAARSIGMGHSTKLDVVEQLQTAMLETPADVVSMMRRTYQNLWQRVLVVARAEGISPVRCLIAAIEEGLPEVSDRG